MAKKPYPLGEFFEASPYLNLLLYPEPVKFKRRNPLDPKRFQYLEGCVRDEAPYDIPTFDKNNDGPLIYLSFGSLGCGDTDLLNRFISELAKTPYRVLANVGDYLDTYDNLPPNVHVQDWFPQPTVISKVDVVIHHGGNNTFTECLYFGKPAIITPYVWDGHDNATRVEGNRPWLQNAPLRLAAGRTHDQNRNLPERSRHTGQGGGDSRSHAAVQWP